jgi:hypothetical protein
VTCDSEQFNRFANKQFNKVLDHDLQNSIHDYEKENENMSVDRCNRHFRLNNPGYQTIKNIILKNQSPKTLLDSFSFSQRRAAKEKHAWTMTKIKHARNQSYNGAATTNEEFELKEPKGHMYLPKIGIGSSHYTNFSGN